MEVRNAQKEDLPRIVQIFNESAALPVNDENELVSVASRQQWFAQFDAVHPLWVAVIGQQVVGWCGLEPFYPHPAYRFSAEISIYVAQCAHRHGVASALLKTADQFAAAHEYKSLVAYIYEQNYGSQRLFAKTGYAHWGQLHNISTVNNQLHSLEIYGKNF